MILAYFIASFIIIAIIVIAGLIDVNHMKKINHIYGKHSNEYKAYKKGAFMGVIKTLIVMGIFYCIMLVVSLYNNTVYSHIKINRHYIKKESMKNQHVKDSTDKKTLKIIDSLKK